MLCQSQAIILSCIKYGDQSLIIKAYTDSKGLLTLISSRRKRKQNQATLFQPFNRLFIDFQFSTNKTIHRVKEASLKTDYDSQYGVMTAAIKMFLAELSMKLIPEEDQNNELFNFLWQKASLLEAQSTKLSDFNINFLHELSQVLGIQPHYETDGDYFDYRESQFVKNKPSHQDYEVGNKALIQQFLEGESLRRNERSKLLNFYLLYLEAQFGGNISRLKSLGVLQAVFS